MAKPWEQYQQQQTEQPKPWEAYSSNPEEDPELEETAPGVWSKIGGGLEVAGTVLSTIAAEPMAGLRGLGAAAGSGLAEMVGGDVPGVSPVDAGVRTAEATREALTYDPRGEQGQAMIADVGSFMAPVAEGISAVEEGLGGGVLEATGSPALAAAAHTVPTALMELTGLKLLKKPSEAAEQAAKAQERFQLDPDMTPEQIADELTDAELKTPEQLARSMRDQDHRTMVQTAEQVRPDQEILDAAEELGIQLNPSHYSTNEAYMRVEQAVKQRPQTELFKREVEALESLGVRADELIGELGDVDKTLFDADLTDQMLGTIDKLEDTADGIFKEINDFIPPATKVTPKASIQYITQRLEQMGGDVSGLSKAEQQLYNVLIKGDKDPTYARIDELRRNVGAGYRSKGPFKDDVSGNLDQVYRVLIADQQNFAKGFGMGPQFAAGRKFVSQRKDLEKQAMTLFGKEVQKSVIPKLTQAANAMTKGDVRQFQNLMAALPENMRTRAAATLLNDLFTHGSRAGGSVGAGFARAYGALNRNAGAKAELFKYLPETARNRFEAIGKVSEGIYRAKKFGDGSPTARFLMQALEDGGAVANLLDRTSDTVLGRMTFVPGPTRWIAAGLKAAKTTAKQAFDKGKAADELMTSPDFERAINVAMEGRVKEADMLLKRSKAWQKYREFLGEGTKRQLAAMGPIAWMIQMDERQAQEQQPGGQ